MEGDGFGFAIFRGSGLGFDSVVAGEGFEEGGGGLATDGAEPGLGLGKEIGGEGVRIQREILRLRARSIRLRLARGASLRMTLCFFL